MTTAEFLLARKISGGGEVTIEQLSVTKNGSYSESGKAFSPVVVNVPEKQLTGLYADENKTYRPSTGYDGFSEVTVDVPLPQNAYLLESQKDDVVTIQHGAEFDMPKLIVSIEPLQTGSGEPSPVNIRLISGWSACNVGDHGKNYAPSSGYTRGLLGWNINNIDEVGSSNTWITSPLIAIKPNTTYTVSCTKGNISRFYVGDIAHNALSYTGNKSEGDTFQVTTGATAKYMRFSIGFDGTTVTTSDYGTLVYCQIEEDNQATTYEPYTGTTYTITFTDGTKPLTVHGGTLDVLSGLLTMTHVKNVIDGVTVNHAYESKSGVASINEYYFNYATGGLYGVTGTGYATVENLQSYGFACSIAGLTDENTRASVYVGSAGYCQPRIRLNTMTSITNVTEMNQYANNLYTNGTPIEYYLALKEPQTYQLNANQIKSLLGNNVIYADTGEVDVQIWTKE